MSNNHQSNWLSNLRVVSLNYRTLGVKQRGVYALFPDDVPKIAKAMLGSNIIGFCISTCNRTEFYAFSLSHEEMSNFGSDN